MIRLHDLAVVLDRFARRCWIYPVALWMVLTMSLLAARVVYSGTREFGFLAWDLALAFIPYLSSLWIAAAADRDRGSWRQLLAPGVIWLLFLPNAPYLVTDLIHLIGPRPPVPHWYDAVLVFAFAWTGCLLGVASLRIMQERVRAFAGTVAAWTFTLAAIALCGPGIYVGRVLRWNSWDVLVRPLGMMRALLAAISDPISHWPAFAASLVFAGLTLGCYVTFAAPRLESSGARSPSR